MIQTVKILDFYFIGKYEVILTNVLKKVLIKKDGFKEWKKQIKKEMK
jgi:hypothetical protein